MVIKALVLRDFESASLVKQLGQRLEFASSLSTEGDEFRKNATLAYLVARKLGKSSTFGLRKCRPKRSMLCTKSRTLGLTRSQFHRHVILRTRMCSRLSSRRSRPSVLRRIMSILHPKVQADAAEEGSYRLAGLYRTDISNMRTCQQHKALTSSQSPITDVMRKPLVVGLGNK